MHCKLIYCNFSPIQYILGHLAQMNVETGEFDNRFKEDNYEKCEVRSPKKAWEETIRDGKKILNFENAKERNKGSCGRQTGSTR